MSDVLLDEWAQKLKDMYGQQITNKIKSQIKRTTVRAGRLIRNKDIDIGEFSDEIMRCISSISHSKRVLRSMLSDDLHEYKDYLRMCISQSYNLNSTDHRIILDFMHKYDNQRTKTLKKIKGCLIKKFSK